MYNNIRTQNSSHNNQKAQNISKFPLANSIPQANPDPFGEQKNPTIIDLTHIKNKGNKTFESKNDLLESLSPQRKADTLTISKKHFLFLE